jgi:hypothetical protein
MWGRSPACTTRSRKTHVTHRRVKIEHVYRPYLTAWEAGYSVCMVHNFVLFTHSSPCKLQCTICLPEFIMERRPLLSFRQ